MYNTSDVSLNVKYIFKIGKITNFYFIIYLINVFNFLFKEEPTIKLLFNINKNIKNKI